jgi:hypothetical protein
MITRRIDILRILNLGIRMKKVERRILGTLLKRGRSYPGDIIMDLRIAQAPGVKTILDLTLRGYILREEGTGFIRINPDYRKEVKIMCA